MISPRSSSRTQSAGAITLERVFGPETRTGTYKHPASIAELANGDLYLVYYGGEDEYATDTAVFGARLEQRTPSWSPPARLARDPFRSAGNAVIWQAPDRRVWLFYVVRWGATWSTSRVQAKVSDDGARSWSDAFVVCETPGALVRCRPIVLTSGAYLLPVTYESGDDTELVAAGSTSGFLRCEPGAAVWAPSGVIISRNGNIQPAVVELANGRLLAYCRRAGRYGPGTEGYIVRSESWDGGSMWTEGQDTLFPNPNAAIDLLRLRSGSLLLIYNDSMTRRSPLRCELSADEGATWPWARNIADGPLDYAYPYAVQTCDDVIHVVYTSHARTVIERATFDEEWVKQ